MLLLPQKKNTVYFWKLRGQLFKTLSSFYPRGLYQTFVSGCAHLALRKARTDSIRLPGSLFWAPLCC